jgi:hypothetical protein
VTLHYENVIMLLIAWRVSMYAFEGRIRILHYSYFYIEVTGKHKSGRDERILERGNNK